MGGTFFEQYQTLIGDLVTLIAAFIGFGGVIYSQRELTKMAEAERAHQANLAKEQVAQERRDELISFLNAIQGELSSLQEALGNSVKMVNAQIDIAEELARSGSRSKTKPRVTFRFATPVFDSQVGRIGLLSPAMAYQVSNLYGRFKLYSTQTQDEVPEVEPGLATRIMRQVEESLCALSDEAESVKIALAET
jgi:hypothetical protein